MLAFTRRGRSPDGAGLLDQASPAAAHVVAAQPLVAPQGVEDGVAELLRCGTLRVHRFFLFPVRDGLVLIAKRGETHADTCCKLRGFAACGARAACVHRWDYRFIKLSQNRARCFAGRALELEGFTGALNPAFPRQARAFPRLRRGGAPQRSAAGLPPGASSCRSPLQPGGKRAVALQGWRFETLKLCLVVDDAQGKRGGPMRQQVESGDLAG